MSLEDLDVENRPIYLADVYAMFYREHKDVAPATPFEAI